MNMYTNSWKKVFESKTSLQKGRAAYKYTHAITQHPQHPLQRAVASSPSWQHSQPPPFVSSLLRGQPKFIAVSAHPENEVKNRR